MNWLYHGQKQLGAVTEAGGVEVLRTMVYSKEILNAAMIFKVLMLAFIPMSLVHVFGTYLTAAGQMRWLAQLALVCLIINVAFNYGGRAEILHATKMMLEDGISPDDLDEELFSSYLFTAGLPDPDIVIRTSGELRISNFLIWQAAYAEYYPTPALWPDFGREELYDAIVAFNQRERRFGLVTEE